MNPIIRTARQKRAIKALVKYGKIGSAELQRLSGQINAPELVASLRRNGWKVFCERIEMLDRDGNICRPGLYFLEPDSLVIARQLVRDWEVAASQTKTKQSTVKSTQI